MIGLTLGKFLPLHLGHLALIEFAAAQCERLIVLVCVAESEHISGETRLQWLIETTKHLGNVTPVLFPYDEQILPNTSVSSQNVSAVWATALKSQFPEVDTFFSSELYGEYVAESWGIRHISFDATRVQIPISASQIRKKPLRYGQYLPEVVKPFFVQKIGILGTESTGKSVLAARLATHFQSNFVAETAREMMSHTENCTFSDLHAIAERHAEAILCAVPHARQVLFIDTTVHLTQSYSQFLFQKSFLVPEWIARANLCDLYLYLLPDAPFVQDGTRLDFEDRNALDRCHRETLERLHIPLCLISGNWDQRFSQACQKIETHLNSLR